MLALFRIAHHPLSELSSLRHHRAHRGRVDIHMQREMEWMAQGVVTMRGEIQQLQSRMELCSHLLSDKLSLESTWEEHLEGAYDDTVLQAMLQEKDVSKQPVFAKPRAYTHQRHWQRLRIRWWRPRFSAYIALHEEFMDLAERRDAVKELNVRFANDCERLRGQISDLRRVPEQQTLNQTQRSKKRKLITAPGLPFNQIEPFVERS